jgi:hypothetical protein
MRDFIPLQLINNSVYGKAYTHFSKEFPFLEQETALFGTGGRLYHDIYRNFRTRNYTGVDIPAFIRHGDLLRNNDDAQSAYSQTAY